MSLRMGEVKVQTAKFANCNRIQLRRVSAKKFDSC
jgi:hypothetical protein